MGERKQDRSTVEVLRAARKRITPIENWTRGVAARDSQGRKVRIDSPAATCWCMGGALELESGAPRRRTGLKFVLRGIRSIGSGARAIAPFNDTNYHKDVLAAFDRAISLAESGSESPSGEGAG
jgi:hypothetical protein